jgi:hypothetical protein
VLTNLLDLTAAEFAFRGFLLFTLVRLIGPLGLVVAAMPFVFAHLGKPELELFSTLGGGMVYGWLAWRTGSIVWGSIGHVYTGRQARAAPSEPQRRSSASRSRGITAP